MECLSSGEREEEEEEEQREVDGFDGRGVGGTWRGDREGLIDGVKRQEG